MCWPVEEMKTLGNEYPELGRLALREARHDGISIDEELDALGEAAGMWYDYGLEEFQDTDARRKVAMGLISFLRQEQQRRELET